MRRRTALEAATAEHYDDPLLYDHEYRRRRTDVNYYRRLAAERKGEVLELGCGSGRVLVPLVRDGHRVVGVDATQTMLDRCAQRLERLRPAARERATLLRADFREFSVGRRFPLIVCPFNAMMHLYTLDDFARFFSCVRAHLAPDGLFAFDVLNPDLTWLVRDPQRRWARTRFNDPHTGRRYLYSTNHTYHAATQINWIRIYYDPVDGSEGPSSLPPVVHLAHRQIFPEELGALLEYNGFVLDRRDGDFHGGPLRNESESQVCRCSIRA